MKHWERIYELHKVLTTRRTPVSERIPEQHLHCSRSTVFRVIADLRDGFGAPIEYSPEHQGYCYNRQSDRPIELPGLWFTAEELRALLVLQRLLAQSQPRLFDQLLAPLRNRLDQVLSHPQLTGDQLPRRVRVVSLGRREPDPAIFERAAAGLIKRTRQEIRYHGRGSAERTDRVISPQRLVHYRDNWYLDGWCHTREALRSFALERIESLSCTDEPAIELGDDGLDAHFAASYGLFGGPPRYTAILRFTAERARWVAEESWFPNQVGEFEPDGRYRLKLPYSDPTELLMDILNYGPDVEVLEPAELRDAVRERLRQALERYEKDEPTQ
ncbi:helix-turn-helix transcriptional regulator [Methylolobus aquaticus]